jgi:hypothetical protein
MGLGEYAHSLKEVIDEKGTIGFLDRIKTYLSQDKETEIDRTSPRASRCWGSSDLPS